MFLFRAFVRIIPFQALLFFFVCCSNIFIEEYSVATFNYDSEKLVVIFSSCVDGEKTKKAFALYENGRLIRGTFSIIDNIFVFHPSEGIKPNCEYEITIGTQAENSRGKSLDEKFYMKFSTKIDSNSPVFEGIYPASGSIVADNLEYVEISFSKPMNRISVQDAILIEPSIDHSIRFTENNTKAIIRFIEKLPLGTDLKITIGVQAKDMFNNNLLEESYATYKIGNDEEPPDFTVFYIDEADEKKLLKGNSIENHCIPCNTELFILFNERINMEYIGSQLEVSPSTLKYSFEPDRINENKVSLKIKGAFNESGKLKIKKGIADLSCNEIKKDETFVLVFDDESNRPVSFWKSFLQVDGKDEYRELSYATMYSEINLSPEYFGNDRIPKKSDIYVLFDVSKKCSGLDYFSVVDSLSFRTTNNCCNLLVKKAEAVDVSDLMFLLEKENHKDLNLACIKCTLEITNTNRNGIVQMNLSDSIVDSLGNKISGPCSLSFNK